MLFRFAGVLTSIGMVFWMTCATAQEDADSSKSFPFLGESTTEDGAGLLPSRLALVVGINNYQTGTLTLPQLHAAAQDSDDVASALRKAGFDAPIVVRTNGTRDYVTRNMIFNAINDLNNAAVSSAVTNSRQPVVLFYFAGHGMSYKGENYILPSDFRPYVAEDIPEMGISVSSLLKRLSWGKPTLKIVVIDACRNYLSQQLPSSETGQLESFSIGQEKVLDPVATGTSLSNNATFVLYATGNGKVSYEGARNGKFTDALLKAFAELMKIAEETDKGEADLGTLFTKMGPRMIGGPSQQPVQVAQSGSFRLFPTFKDFQLETSAWKDANQILMAKPGPDLAKQVDAERFCRLQNFLVATSYYSFYSEAANRWVIKNSDQADSDCTKYNLRATISLASQSGFVVQNGRWSSAGLSPVSGSAPSNSAAPADNSNSSTRTVTVADASVKGSALAGALGASPVNSLAVAAASIALRSAPSETAPIKVGLQQGELLQIIKIFNSQWLNVRTQNGDIGFATQREVISGRAAVKFDLPLHADNLTGNLALHDLDNLIDSSIVTDAQVQYNALDGIEGLARASSISNDLGLRLTKGRNASVVVRVKSINHSADLTEAPPGVIQVSLVLLPLSKGTREQLPAVATSSIPTSAAVNLNVLRDSGSTAGEQELESPPRAGLPNQRLSKMDLCLGIVSRENNSMKSSRAYVQIATAFQQNLAESIRQVLRSAKLAAGNPEVVGSKSPRSQNQVRYCQGQKDVAARASKSLEQCGFGKWRSLQIKCSPTTHHSIELWLAADPGFSLAEIH